MRSHLKSARALTHASIVLLVFALLAGGGRGVSGAGVRYEPRGGGFSASFPAAPEKRSQKQDFGSFVMTVSAYGLDHEGMAYFVTWFGDLPLAAMRDPLMDDIFYTRLEHEYTVTGKAAGKGEVTVAARSDISLGGFSGRQYVFNSPIAMGVVRGYKVGQRFYMVGVFGDKEGFSAPRAVAFLDSFKLTGKK
jgi:hypothetical protein